ncbi:MAG: response regulator [Desulfobacterales bacterium]|nr:response regulator [Desulfobacterales bacterium]
MKILIVDDNTVILSVIEAILSQENHEVFSGSNGVLGYNQYLNIRPDLVVTDIEMPWQDGISMVQSIRRHAPLVRTLYMTGNPGPYLASLKLEQRCHPVGVLHKPFTRSALLRAINDVALLEISPAMVRQTSGRAAVPNHKKRFRESLSRAKFKVEGLYERAERPYDDVHGFADHFTGNRRRAGAGR